MVRDTTIVIGDSGGGRGVSRRWLLITVGALIIAVLLVAVVFYHPTKVTAPTTTPPTTPPTSPTPPPTNVSLAPPPPPPSYVVLGIGDLAGKGDPQLSVLVSDAYLELSNGSWVACPINKVFNMYQLVNASQVAAVCKVPSGGVIAVSVNITQVTYVSGTTTLNCELPAHFITIALMKYVNISSSVGANITIDMQMVNNVNISSIGCIITPRFFVYTHSMSVSYINTTLTPTYGSVASKPVPPPHIPSNLTVTPNSPAYPPIMNGTSFSCVAISRSPPNVICGSSQEVFPPPSTSKPTSPPPPPQPVEITFEFYNPSNQSTANPHIQPIWFFCGELAQYWKQSFGYAPSCQDMINNVTFIENGQVLPAYPSIFDYWDFQTGSVQQVIIWWVKMPAIPPETSVEITMELGNPSSITSPQNVFPVYGYITSFQPGYIYVINATYISANGVTIIYNKDGVGGYAYITIVNSPSENDVFGWLTGILWGYSELVFTPNSNPLTNGFHFTASGIEGQAWVVLFATPSGQLGVAYEPTYPAPILTPIGGTVIGQASEYGVLFIPESTIMKLYELGPSLGGIWYDDYIVPLGIGDSGCGSGMGMSSNPYYAVWPTCYAQVNPYGAPGTYGLPSAYAIEQIPNPGMWGVLLFYEPPGGEGVLMSMQNAQYPASPSSYAPNVYVSGSSLYVGDYVWPNQYSSSPWYTTFQLSPGWHVLAYTEYGLENPTWNYHITAWLDSPSNTESISTLWEPSIFGPGPVGPLPDEDVGTGYTPSGWQFYDGVIALAAVFPGVPSNSTVNEVFNILSQTYNYVPGFAYDYPPGGEEPILIGAQVTTQTSISILLPSQLMPSYYTSQFGILQ